MENQIPQIIEPGVIERLTSAERKSQIEVARQYPRMISRFKKNALEMATSDEATAASCFYSIPRGGTHIEGPSVRLAEIVASAWGNLRAQARVVDVTEKHVIAEGMVWDLETNVAVSMEVRRRITNRKGDRYNDDMITVTGNAAAAIAFRNAVFKVIPRLFVNQIYEAARQVAVGDASTLALKQKQWVDYAQKFSVTPEQICGVLGIGEISDLSLDNLKTLAGMFSAIKEGDISVDSAFAMPDQLPEEGRRSFGPKKKKATEPDAAQPDATITRGEDGAPEVSAGDGDADPDVLRRAVADGIARTKDQTIADAKKLIDVAETMDELLKLTTGETRKTLAKVIDAKTNEIAETAKQPGLADDDVEPPHDPKTGEVIDDPPPEDGDAPSGLGF